MEDFEYKGIICLYLPHPKLQGKYECWLADSYEDDKDHFIGRFNTKQQCKKAIEKYLKELFL